MPIDPIVLICRTAIIRKATVESFGLVSSTGLSSFVP